ncbi:MAG TPA: hypothetical protein VH416_04680 [Gaiellaceae bacterium]
MREIRTVWALVLLVAVAVAVTYVRLPAVELYNVSGSGIGAGLGRALVELNFPDALVALGVLAAVAGSLSRSGRAVALVAALLCALVVVPGVVRQSDLDARAINVLPALGVLLAVVLSLGSRTPSGPGHARGDVTRVAILAVGVLAASPWIAAELGFYLDGVPLLGWLFQTGRKVSFRGNAPHPAVHHGVHHGLQGLLLVTTALLLSRLPRAGRLRTVAGMYLALMLAYGVGNMVNDDWLEQVAERGWTERTFPSVLEPALNWGWLAVLVVAAGVWALWFRYPARTTPASASAAISSCE